MSQEMDATPPDAGDEAPVGIVHEKLEGWIPPMASEQEIRHALEQAFDYRGDLTIWLKDGERIDGYVFDRNSNGATLDDCMVRLFPKDRDEKVSLRYSSIARLEFSGRDTAAGRSFETWVKKYREKKAAGEKNIELTPEKLD